MSLSNKNQKEENKEKMNENDYEARQNLFGFFNLLLDVDKRVNPHLYKKDDQEKEYK